VIRWSEGSIEIDWPLAHGNEPYRDREELSGIPQPVEIFRLILHAEAIDNRASFHRLSTEGRWLAAPMGWLSSGDEYELSVDISLTE
jgi:hypothetical protein